MTRTEQVILLLGSLEDSLPAPETWTGNLVARAAKSGPGPSSSKRCTACDGRKTVRDRFNRESPCSTCEGKGRVFVDGYTGQRVGTADTATVRHVSTVRCDSCWGEGRHGNGRACTYCRGSGRRTITPRELLAVQEGAPGAPSAGDLDLWGRGGSYHELAQALDQLHAEDPDAHRLVWRTYVRRTSEVPDRVSFAGQLLAYALDQLADLMPDPILVPSGLAQAERRLRDHGTGVRGRWANAAALVKRDAEIRRHHRDGRAQQWIARQFGLTPARVSQLLKETG